MSNVVVLTKYWHFWGERPLRDAIRLIVKGKVEIIKADESKHIKTGLSRSGATFKMPAPLVIRLLEFGGYKIKKTTVKYSDAAIYNRDKNICQYWHYDDKGKPFKYRCSEDDRTKDHVLPRSRGGEDSFENVVTCCRWHNVDVKKNLTPEEAGLKLIRKPTKPRYNKGDMAILTFTFNPHSEAHKAYCECLGMEFSHRVK